MNPSLGGGQPPGFGTRLRSDLDRGSPNCHVLALAADLSRLPDSIQRLACSGTRVAYIPGNHHSESFDRELRRLILHDADANAGTSIERRPCLQSTAHITVAPR